MLVDPKTNEILKRAEDVLKDRFSGYVIACMDGDKIYHTYNSTIIAYGLLDFVKMQVERD